MAEEPTPTQAPARRSWRWLWWLLGILLALLLVIAGTAAWLLNTTSGARFAIDRGLGVSGGQGTVENLQGNLWNGLTADSVRFATPSLELEVDALKVALVWPALWHREVVVTELAADRVRVNTISGPAEPSQPWPQDIGLPVKAQVQRLALGSLEIAQDGTPVPVALSGLAAQANAGPDGYQIKLENADIAAQDISATLRGDATLGAAQPFALQAAIVGAVRQAERQFDVDAAASGSLGDMQVTLKGEGSGISVDALARAGLLDGGFPLRAVRLDARGIDPSAWVPDAPKAELELGADLKVVPVAGAGPQLQGPIWARNAAAGRWDAGVIPVESLRAVIGAPLTTFDAAKVTDLSIGLPGGGTVTGDVAWTGAPQGIGLIDGTLTLANVDAAALHSAAVPTKLSGPVSFAATQTRQTVEVDLRERSGKTPLALRASAALEANLLKVSQATLSAGAATAEASGQLALDGKQAFAAKLALRDFDPAAWIPGMGLPPTRITAQGEAQGTLSPEPQGDAKIAIDPASRWNNRPLSGDVAARFVGAMLPKLDAQLQVADNRIDVRGAVGRATDKLAIDVEAPTLEALWPGVGGRLTAKGNVVGTLDRPVVDATIDGGRLKLPGDVRIDRVQGTVGLGTAGKPQPVNRAPVVADLRINGLSAASAPQASVKQAVVSVKGTLAEHEGSVDAEIVPAEGQPAQIAGSLKGGWGTGPRGSPGANLVGWRGTVSALEAQRKPFAVSLERPVTIRYLPDARAPQWQWDVGATAIAVTLPEAPKTRIEHAGSRGRGAQWETKGRIEGLAWSPELQTAWFGDGGVTVRSNNASVDDHQVLIDADWDLRFADALAGTARIARRSGDIWIPGEPPVALGLTALLAEFRADPMQGGRSRLTAQLNLAGERIGSLRGNAQAEIVASGGSIALDDRRPAQADLSLDIKDLGWLSLFTGDALEVGGAVAGDVKVVRDAGAWRARGAVRGEGLRIVRIDDGVRLLDGRLQARLEDDRIIIDSLRFPGVMRARPGDARIREWMQSEDARNGELTASGEFALSGASGKAKIVARQFPAIQRADRFIAASGEIDVELAPRRLRVVGDLVADAGWVYLGTSTPATLDSDVVIRRRTTDTAQRPTQMGMSINVGVDLGPRFYLRGMGIDTALGGKLRILGEGGTIRANGTVRTRDGQYSAYGQTLTIRRGAITFQGPLDDPLLDIVALRVGPQVQAGARIGGSARHLRISLVSEPEVSDVEKLSWLLLGRGPDDTGGADAGMLLSAATSLLGDEEGVPLARQLGVDELGIRSGNVGSSRGLLPERTVAGESTSSSSDLATEFFIVGKRLSESVYATYEQALSGGDGVVRLSYELSRRLQLVGRGGTINGVDLMYTILFGDD